MFSDFKFVFSLFLLIALSEFTCLGKVNSQNLGTKGFKGDKGKE